MPDENHGGAKKTSLLTDVLLGKDYVKSAQKAMDIWESTQGKTEEKENMGSTKPSDSTRNLSSHVDAIPSQSPKKENPFDEPLAPRSKAELYPDADFKIPTNISRNFSRRGWSFAKGPGAESVSQVSLQSPEEIKPTMSTKVITDTSRINVKDTATTESSNSSNNVTTSQRSATIPTPSFNTQTPTSSFTRSSEISSGGAIQTRAVTLDKDKEYEPEKRVAGELSVQDGSKVSKVEDEKAKVAVKNDVKEGYLGSSIPVGKGATTPALLEKTPMEKVIYIPVVSTSIISYISSMEDLNLTNTLPVRGAVIDLKRLMEYYDDAAKLISDISTLATTLDHHPLIIMASDIETEKELPVLYQQISSLQNLIFAPAPVRTTADLEHVKNVFIPAFTDGSKTGAKQSVAGCPKVMYIAASPGILFEMDMIPSDAYGVVLELAEIGLLMYGGSKTSDAGALVGLKRLLESSLGLWERNISSERNRLIKWIDLCGWSGDAKGMNELLMLLISLKIDGVVVEAGDFISMLRRVGDEEARILKNILSSHS